MIDFQVSLVTWGSIVWNCFWCQKYKSRILILAKDFYILVQKFPIWTSNFKIFFFYTVWRYIKNLFVQSFRFFHCRISSLVSHERWSDLSIKANTIQNHDWREQDTHTQKRWPKMQIKSSCKYIIGYPSLKKTI